MVIAINREHEIPAHNCRYLFHKQHRSRGNVHKSKWSIALRKELECFTKSLNSGWTVTPLGWGVHYIRKTQLLPLGCNRHNESLYIAKFVDGSSNQTWHGYPADFVRNSQDRPSTNVLTSWRDLGLIKKHHISKIRQGKKCDL